MKCSPVSTQALHDLYLLSWQHPLLHHCLQHCMPLLEVCIWIWCGVLYVLSPTPPLWSPYLSFFLVSLLASTARWQTLSCIFIQVVVSPSCPTYRSGIHAILVEAVVTLMWPPVSNACGLAKCTPKHIPEKELCSASNGRDIEAQITQKNLYVYM